jgi:peroxiredoxin
VALRIYTNGKRVFDTVEVNNGLFSFKGRLNEPEEASLTLLVDSVAAAKKGIVRGSSMPRDYVSFFLDKGNIEIITVDSFSNSTIKGSAVQDEFLKVNAKVKPVMDDYRRISKEYVVFYRAKDEAGMARLRSKFDEIDSQLKKIHGEFVKANPQSPYAIFALRQFAGHEVDAAAIEPIFNTLPADVRESASGKAMAEKIAIAKKTGIGAYAMDFTQNDTADVPVNLTSFRGKYVLLDFWASWCGPCRAENPNVVKVFNRYKDKGFTVLGVSLDRPGQKERWMKAIHDDQLYWTHVSDLKFWDNAVAKQYVIEAIPQNYLLDPQGKIIAKGIRGEELEKKLAEIFP